ncbi:dTDP-4-dehydrorhamnose 3,5-epimerase [Paragemmobacter straminiformis]|uniref:dTDP-4-dehydrorhamnose 3,5-epimerase n=1 Tax=Paragemmobacter straminiformis TaxID=2045119 RepID=A0A842I8A8_9RHOB|nr:dTDP-4-dehydrorhamnose 3,5-epimerase [Gemmobacter straminiformis]MBC2835811.1 dTDP-4-dehydrorhamnose 3,5-epimerase [Gemmobacter straminiformis]
MRFHATPLPDLIRVESDAPADARGSFRRIWCAESFAAAGVGFVPVQASLSSNLARHTLRGLHWQDAPYGEQKLVRCVAGAVWDVAVDMRRHSATYLQWHAAELSAENGVALFLPQGFAHGFLTLTDGAVVDYMIDAPYEPHAARGARWNDPAFGIDWPAAPAVLSQRDRDWPDHG